MVKIRLVRERKRREADPAADALRDPPASQKPTTWKPPASCAPRLQGLLEIFDLADAAFRQIFTDLTLDGMKNMLGDAGK